MTDRFRIAAACALCLAALLAATPSSAQQSLPKASDVWITPEGSNTAVDFADDPLPADFFCAGSAPFDGVVHLQGEPLATDPPDALRGADTIVEREDGSSEVKARIVALSLRSEAPLSIDCESGTTLWDVRVTALPDQETTILQIAYNDDGTGGTFGGAISVSVLVEFLGPQSAVGKPVNLERRIDFKVEDGAPWSTKPGGDGWESPAAVVDTNGDGEPDREILPGAGFFPGWSPVPLPGCLFPPCRKPIRHEVPRHAHVTVPPNPPHC